MLLALRPGYRPDDIAGAAAYPCSTDAGFVIGQMIDVNGGANVS